MHPAKVLYRRTCISPTAIGNYGYNATLNMPSATETSSEFWSLWRKVVSEMEAKGIRPGPESFKGWNDGDAAFVRAIWYLLRSRRTETVVETGVAHGVTSCFILEALERNGPAIGGALTVHRWNGSGSSKSALRSMTD